MGKRRSPERDKAFRLYKESGGTLPLVEIAAQLNLPEGTIRGWKNKDHWNGTVPKNTERSKNKSPNKILVETVESNEELSEQQKFFCLYYIKTFNATMAYMKAYHSTYENANGHASRLLLNPKIREEIKQLKEIRSMGILATADDVVDRYMKIAFADMTDYVEWGRATVAVMGPFGPIYEGKGKDKRLITQDVNDVRFKESTEVDGTLIAEVKQGKDGASVKLADRMKALDWLSRYFELNPSDRHKQEYDKRRLEIELLKTQASIKTSGDESVPDDGFTEALNGKAADIWQNDDDSAKDSEHVG
nr:terminase small subunit [uncultured Caproiciproducens sp.]